MLPLVLLVLAGAPASVPATVLETHFLCGQHVVEQLVLVPGAEAALRVPDDCPDHGASWSLTLECVGKCRGALSDKSGRIAGVAGPAQKEAVLEVTAEPKAPASVGFLVLRVAELAKADATAALKRPVRVSIWGETFGKSFLLDDAPVTIDADEGHVLSFELKRLDGKRVRLVARDQRGGDAASRRTVFEQVLKLDGDDAPFDCARTAGFCAGAGRIRVREYRPLEAG